MVRVKKVHHIGVVVRDVDQAASFYEEVFGGKVIAQEWVEVEQEKSAFVLVGGTIIELMEPVDSQSELGKFLSRRGEGLHSIALKLENFDEAVRELEGRGLRVVGKQERPFKYAFVHPKDACGVMLEISEYGRPNDPLTVAEGML